MRRNRVTAPTDLMSELDSDDDDKKLSTQSTVVSPSTAATRGLSTQKTLVSPAASADKPPNPARTAPKTKVSAKRRQVTNAPSSTQSTGNGLFSHRPSPTIHSGHREFRETPRGNCHSPRGIRGSGETAARAPDCIGKLGSQAVQIGCTEQ